MDGTCEGLPSPHLWTLCARPFATWVGVKWCLPFQLPREQEGRAGPAQLEGMLLSGRSSPEPLKCTSSCHFPISDLDKPKLTLKACTPHRDFRLPPLTTSLCTGVPSASSGAHVLPHLRAFARAILVPGNLAELSSELKGARLVSVALHGFPHLPVWVLPVSFTLGICLPY